MTNGRNPTKKRGRPRRITQGLEMTKRRYMQVFTGATRNAADMTLAVARGLDPAHQDEWLALMGENKITVTTLAYLARLPASDQVALFEMFRQRGARWAKRFIECMTRPPTRAAIAARLLDYLAREFPDAAVDVRDVAAALRMAAEALER